MQRRFTQICRLTVFFSSFMVLSACQQSESDEQAFNALALDKKSSNVEIVDDASDFSVNKFEPVPEDASFKTVEWVDLLPKDDLEALLNPPEYLNDILDGSVEDQIESNLGSSIEEPLDRYQAALVSQRIIPELDGQALRIPGFIVPLEFGDEAKVTKFFLVPFFGACIHLPPPPPNQIIYVEYPKGLAINSTYIPYWISGVLNTSLIENDVATAAYVMSMQYIEDYNEE
jgi:hypothetical protein